MKSIPGRNYSGSVAQKAIRRISSNITKRIKRPIRAEQDGSSFYGGDTNLTLSAMSCSDIEETANTAIQSGVAFHTVGKTSPPLPTLDSLYTMCLRGSYVLCPQINVTPELTVVDTSMCSLWVAVEVIGVLRRADGQDEYGNGAERYPSHSSSQPAGILYLGLVLDNVLISYRPKMLWAPAFHAARPVAKSRLHGIGNLWQPSRAQNSRC